MEFGFTAFPAIAVICYLIAQIVKSTPLDNKFLPIITGGAGGILGVIGMYIIPNYPATDLYSAMAIGIVSGLAATGANQIYKQLTKDGGDQ
jgi:hypothetical protein